MKNRRHGPAVSLALITVVLSLASACTNSETPTSPESGATLSGNVVSGTSGRIAPLGGTSLPGVTVRVGANGPSAQTDANGGFVLRNVPQGAVVLQFERADIHATGNVFVPAAGTLVVTVSIVGANAVIVPGGNAGEEIEGLIVSVDAGANGLRVQDQRLGTVEIRVTDTTVIRHGQTAIPLADLEVGWRVHVKAMLGGDGVYTATEIIVQNQNPGDDDDDDDEPQTVTANGHIESIDDGAKSFVVRKANGGSATVMTDGATTFKKHGDPITFGDLVVGNKVECQGTPQPDGSILARKVVVQ